MARHSRGKPCQTSQLILLLLQALLLSTVRAIKLRFTNTECVEEYIEQPSSLITISVVSQAQKDSPAALFDITARDPQSVVVYSRTGIDDAELVFKNRIVGRHTFCLSVAQESRQPGFRMMREVLLDIVVGETWDHDRVKEEHMDSLQESISLLQQRVQRLRSETRHLKFREMRHRNTAESTNRRVLRYAFAKMAVILLVAGIQTYILQRFFKDS